MLKHIDRSTGLFFIILLVGLSLGVWGLSYDLPYIYHPDEPFFITLSQDIFKAGNLNPHFFNYPSLFFYINSLAYLPYFYVGKLLGIFAMPSDILAPISLAMGVTRTSMPSTVLMGRVISLLLSAGTIATTYLAGRQLTGKAIAGLLASLMVAVSLPNVSLGRFIAPDPYVCFLASASFLASALVYKRGGTRYYVLGGILAGLTASTKYNGGVIVLPLIAAHFLRLGRHGFKSINIYIAFLACIAGFLAGTPLFLVNFQEYWAGIIYEIQHYSLGHPGMDGGTLRWYLSYMWTTGAPVYILSILGIIRGIYSRSKEIILLSIFPLVYFVYINNYIVRNDRTFLILTPYMFLLAASFVEFLISKASAIASPTWRKASNTGLIVLTALTILFPTSVTVRKTIELTTLDSRATSRSWIAGNLPAGAKIAVESYSSFVDPGRFSVQGFTRIIDHAPDWYASNGFDYLVFGYWMYGRFFAEPDRYSLEISQYNEFFNRFELVHKFNDGNYEIRIYRVSAVASG